MSSQGNFRSAFKGIGKSKTNETDPAIESKEEAMALEEQEIEDDNEKNSIPKDESIIQLDDLKDLDEVSITPTQKNSIYENTNPTETTVITTGTVINGPIVSEGNIIVRGEVKGDIECINLRISGKVCGNISCVSSDLEICNLIGDVTVKEKLVIKSGTKICGNISAKDVEINGLVKGNFEVKESISILESSSIIGDVCAKTIEVSPGAIIQGQIKIHSDDQQRLNFDES